MYVYLAVKNGNNNKNLYVTYANKGLISYSTRKHFEIG